MDIIFEIIDKSGRKIRLTKERWCHISKHPEMTLEQHERIVDTLKNPQKIIGLKYKKEIKFYFKYYKLFRKYLLVMVKYLNGEGFIITSYYTNKIK